MSEEIISPPWPNDSARVDTLFDRLKELHQWAVHYREVVNQASDHQAVPPLREVPRKAVHDSLPVVCHYANYAGVRKIRELWDGLVREFEDSWDTKLAFMRRRQLIVATVEFLNQAWLSHELRELKQAAAQEQFLKESMAKSFGFMGGTVPPSEELESFGE